MDKNLKRDDLVTIIKACVLIIIGLLFCFSLKLATKTLSIILGSGVIAAGVLFVLLDMIRYKDALSPNAVLGYILISFGILIIVSDVIGMMLSLVPYLLITLGAGLIIDAFLDVIYKKIKNILIFVLKLFVGAVFIALGICLITVPEVAARVSLVFGISLILIAIYLIAMTLNTKKKKTKK